MTRGDADTAVAPDAAATLASPPAAAVLAPPAPSPPIMLPLPFPPSIADDRMIPWLPPELQKLIGTMVLDRVKHNWPLVRASECRSNFPAGLQPGEWVVFKSLDQGAEPLILVGKVLQRSMRLRVSKRFQFQSEYFGPPEFLKVSEYSKVPGTSYFINTLFSTRHDVRPRDLLAVGFKMEPVEGLPLSWPLALRRPGCWTPPHWSSLCDGRSCASSIEHSWTDHRDGPETGIAMNFQCKS